jgi:hypothetical protein
MLAVAEQGKDMTGKGERGAGIGEMRLGAQDGGANRPDHDPGETIDLFR